VNELLLDEDRCYRAARSRDRRFDGVFYLAVKTTGIYCRPSCPAMTPRRHNVRFYPTAAAAHDAGFRACRRCLPDATPGSPDWDVRADVAGRAMRLISDGLVEREGVTGLAKRLGYGQRHLNRVLSAELGAGPLALARARRAQTARVLIETTRISMADAAFAAGFASIRQFNDTIRTVYACSPRELRASAAVRSSTPSPMGELEIRLPMRLPFNAPALLSFLGPRSVAGLESVANDTLRRVLTLPNGPAVVELRPDRAFVRCRLRMTDLRDLGPAVERCRRLFDLDADPVAVDESLETDPVLQPLVNGSRGVRIPGQTDGFELAARAIVGQQVSVAGARTTLGRLVRRFGQPLGFDDDELTHAFPNPGALVEADPTDLGMPAPRGRALTGLAAAVAAGQFSLDRGADRAEVVPALLALPGIGPWTANYIAMRALGDPDVFMSSDLGVRDAMKHLGLPADPAGADAYSQRWRPWRSYAQMYLWNDLIERSKNT
jgi:AraC family transcriptional regulator, regulatory protein of adaptative response / DNA-3-methyladenine glycosylase II